MTETVKKGLHGRDADGLRDHCPDGHLLVWSPYIHSGRKGRYSDGAYGGICTADDMWDQSYASSKSTRRPALTKSTSKGFVKGGYCYTTIRQKDGVAYMEQLTLNCARLQWSAEIRTHYEWRDSHAGMYERWADRLSPEDMAKLYAELAEVPERPAPTSLQEMQTLIDTLKEQGWRFEGGVFCPTCVDEIDAYKSDMAIARESEEAERIIGARA